jgi:hypothetical protein
MSVWLVSPKGMITLAGQNFQLLQWPIYIQNTFLNAAKMSIGCYAIVNRRLNQ